MTSHGGVAQHLSPHPHLGHPPHYPPNRGSPPMKKSKGNPIITRYPPPPGYRPPIPPPNQYQQPQWPQQPQVAAYGFPQYASYQPAPYGQAQPHQAPQTQFTGYPPQQFLPNPHPHPPVAHPGWQMPMAGPQGVVPFIHHQQPSPYDYDPRRRSSGPFPAHDPRASISDDNIDPYPQQYSPGSPEDDDHEDEFAQPCYFARYPEEINPKLSLGLIEWKAPLPTRRPLPSTFADAELEALAPRVPKASDDESISEYFIHSRRDESLNSVRLSETWHEIKDDLIFKEFSVVCREVLSMYELLSMWKDRIDPNWAAGERSSPTPELSREATPTLERVRNDSMDIKQIRDLPDNKHSASTTDHRMLDGLEQALSSQDESMNNMHDRRPIHSRSTSATSQNLPKLKRPKPLPPLRDVTQENVLAALGVTGSPKMVYETPGPAFGPPPETGSGHNARPDSFKSIRPGPQAPTHPLPAPPFLKRGRSPSSDPWKQGSGNPYKNSSSAAGRHTASGSAFGCNSDNPTSRPKFQRQDSRKRGYADSDFDNAENQASLDEEAALKQRRKQPRVSRGQW